MRAALAAVLIALAGPALADCPDFYRFVDFGITDEDGTLYRGGPVFRAEDFDGTPLLFTRSTVCEEVADLLKDGRGNPIPVVSKIAYDRRATDPALGWIEVAARSDAHTMALAGAKLHAERLELGDIRQIKGDDHLCALTPVADLSCQVISPYANDTPLLVFCENGDCTVYVMAMTERLIISASWPQPDLAPEAQGAAIAAQTNAIAAFLAPISSGL